MTEQLTNPNIVDTEMMRISQLLEGDHTITLNDTGWDSRVYLVNDGEYVFKFPRSDKIRGRYPAQLDALRQAATIDGPVHVPEVLWTDQDNAYFGYRGVPGVLLKPVMAELDAAQRAQVGAQLGTFLRRFHGMTVTGARDMSPAAEIAQLHDWFERGRERATAYLTADERERLATKVYEQWPRQISDTDAKTVTCHGDFHFKNIFYDEGRLSIIDFGDVCQADPTKDFIYLDDSIVFEAALEAYDSDDEAFKAKVAIRQAMIKVIHLTGALAKHDAAAIDRAVTSIRQVL